MINKNRKFAIVGAVVVIILIVFAVKFDLFAVRTCENIECFQEMIQDCEPSEYINDGVEATWKYKILGEGGDGCLIAVTLLQPKSGDFEVEALRGMKMECVYPRGYVEQPGGNLDACHGELKEELQGIVIRKLHEYILENLGEIGQEVGAFG